MIGPDPGARLGRALREPGRALEIMRALLRGAWYRFWYRLRGKRFTVGRNFRVFGSLVLKGPGEVVMGDNVTLMGRVTPWTYSPDARVAIGDCTMMDGVRIGCAQEVTIGRNCIIAECRITDTDFHSTHVNRRTDPAAPVRTLPVIIEDNVWIAVEVGLLPGAWIGRNSAVGYGSVCGRRYPENSILLGNPAKVIAPVPGTAPPQPAEAEPKSS